MDEYMKDYRRKNKGKKAYYKLEMPPELKAAIEKQASIEDTSFNRMVLRCVKFYFKHIIKDQFNKMVTGGTSSIPNFQEILKKYKSRFPDNRNSFSDIFEDMMLYYNDSITSINELIESYISNEK